MATATTMQGSRDEWMKEWMTMALEPAVHSGYYSKSRSLAPMEEGSYTNLLACASSPRPANMTMTTSPGPDIGDPTSPAFGSNTTLDSLLTTAGTEACYASYSPSFECNGDANVIPATATSAQVDNGNTTDPAFDSSAYADSLPTTAEQVDDNEWISRLMDVDVDPVVHSDYLFCSDLFDNPSEDDTNAMLASTLGGAPGYQSWDSTSLHEQRSVAESQEQGVPVALAWGDPFMLV